MPVRRRNATTAVLLMLVFLCASGYGQTAPKPAPPTVTTLILQGKDQYRKARYVQALQKFEAALKLEPLNDEALGLGADTAFRLDNQVRMLAQSTVRLPDPRLGVVGSQRLRVQELRFDLVEFGGYLAQLVAVLDSAPAQQVSQTPPVIGDASAERGPLSMHGAPPGL